ncbi:hypothetical protein TNCV_2858781 [Trichonephila clavipes]|nr:hypothetical protein TNCV_2858781 [Trichonephila clavipes]
MLNRFYFPPTLPHSTHICLLCLCRISNLDLYRKERQLRPSQNIQKKKDVKSIIFPNQTFRILPTFICGAGPENQHMTSITKNDNSGPHKIFNRKKMLNRFYFPPTLPHSTHILLLCRTGYPTQDLFQKNDNSGRHKIFKRKKMLNRLYFPPNLPHSTNILLWRRTGEPTHDLHHQERQLRPSQNIHKKKDVKSFIFPTYPPAFHPHCFVAQYRRTNT